MRIQKNQIGKHILIIFTLLLTTGISAETITWIGGNGDWSVPGNWDLGTVPDFGDEVTILSGMVNIYSTGNCSQISILPDATLTIGPNGNLYLEADADGIYNEGTINNDGYMSFTSISVAPFQSEYGIHNFGQINQNGTLDILSNFHYGIVNAESASLVNTGTINCYNVDFVGLNNYGTVTSEGNLFFQNSHAQTLDSINLEPFFSKQSGNIELEFRRFFQFWAN